MPKIAAKVINSGINAEGKMLGLLQFNGQYPPKDTTVSVKWGSVRTQSQNALYWVFLTWLINEGGLHRQGHFCPEALHVDLKAHFIADKEFTMGQFKAIEEATTTDMGKKEFGEYIDKVNEFMKEFFSIDTEPFWAEHRETHGTY